MCFGGDGGAGKIAEAQRQDETARQARIKQGMAKIQAIFDGGSTYGKDPAGSYDPSSTYYLADGTPYNEMGSGRPGGGRSFDGFGDIFYGPGFRDTPERLLESGQLFTGVGKTSGFDDAFYKKRATDYANYATPQLDKQSKLARDQLIFALSRTGNLDSSAAIQKNAELTDAQNTKRIEIANEGLNQSNALRNTVEGARSNLVSELNATGDDSAASANALRQIQNLNQPAGFSPLGDMFASFAQGISQIGSNQANGYSGFSGNGGAGLFTSAKGSQRVVGAG